MAGVAAMEQSYVVRRQRDYVEIRFSGSLGADAIVSVLEAIGWTDVRATKSGLLWDLRNADLSAYRMDDMMHLRAYDSEGAGRMAVRRETPTGRKFRIAAVFSGSTNELILRLWESMGGGAEDLERRSFIDIREARRWVCKP